MALPDVSYLRLEKTGAVMVDIHVIGAGGGKIKDIGTAARA